MERQLEEHHAFGDTFGDFIETIEAETKTQCLRECSELVRFHGEVLTPPLPDLAYVCP